LLKGLLLRWSEDPVSHWQNYKLVSAMRANLAAATAMAAFAVTALAGGCGPKADTKVPKINGA
jgi:hypothetical protein